MAWSRGAEYKKQLEALCDLDDPIETGDIRDIIDSVEKKELERKLAKLKQLPEADKQRLLYGDLPPYAEIRRLSEDDCKEIYEFAMKRSEEMQRD